MGYLAGGVLLIITGLQIELCENQITWKSRRPLQARCENHVACCENRVVRWKSRRLPSAHELTDHGLECLRLFFPFLRPQKAQRFPKFWTLFLKRFFPPQSINFPSWFSTSWVSMLLWQLLIMLNTFPDFISYIRRQHRAWSLSNLINLLWYVADDLWLEPSARILWHFQGEYVSSLWRLKDLSFQSWNKISVPCTPFLFESLFTISDSCLQLSTTVLFPPQK